MLTTPRGSGAEPELTEILGAQVHWGPVPAAPPDGQPMPRVPEGRVLVTDDSVWFEDAQVRLLVRGTDRVWIEPRAGRAASDVAHYLYSFVVRLLLLHAGRFSIHASAVRTPHGAVVVGGDSGAGKSTTCVALAARGGQLLVDDVAPLRRVGAHVVVEPFDRPIHLLADALARVDLSGLMPVARSYAVGPEGKTVLGFAAAGELDPVPVRCLVVLEEADDTGPVPSARPVVGGDRLQWIVRLSNAVGISSYGSRAVPYFAWAAQVADALPMLHIRRAPGVDCLGAVVDLVEEAIGQAPVPLVSGR